MADKKPSPEELILKSEGEMQDDGSVVFDLEGDEDSTDSPEFLANLAETIDETRLTMISTTLTDLVEEDRQSRSKRDEKYKEGLRRTGLGDDAPGGATFEGSSRVVHPVMAESCIDFESRAIKELFPANGPVKMQIIGKQTEEKLARAERKVKFLNWQLTHQMREYRPTLEQILIQTPMGGSQYEKFYYDQKFKRPRTCFVPVDDILIPYSSTDFYTSHRITHVMHLTRFELDERVSSGMYRDVLDSIVAPVNLEESAASEANRKIEGKEESGMNEDGSRDVYEIYTYLELEEDELTDGEMAPYIVTIDDDTGRVLAIYRNWDEQDELRRMLEWIVEYQFMPWRGAYGIGFPHLIGGLSGAATGALRALLDSAHIQNSATLVKLKSNRQSGKSIQVEPTEIAEIEGPANTDDIRKVIMPMPYNPPSTVLFTLLGWLTDAAKGVIATTEEQMGQIGDRTPVGTTMAMIEQGSATYSAIHARLHYSQAKALQILCRINAQFLEDEFVVSELDELVVTRADFQNNSDICPVSDPNIFSEAQRFAQVQGIIQIRQQFPNQAFDENYIARMALKRMRVEDVDSILPETKKPQNLNPVAENVAALAGTPLLALPAQNHMAHILCHLDFAGSPVYGGAVMGAKMLPIIVEHVKQHLGFYYSSLMEELTHFAERAGETPTQQMEQELLQAQGQVMATLNSTLPQIVAALEQLQQRAAQMQPQPPMDPAIQATKEVAMADIERKRQYDQAMIQIEQSKVAGAQQNDLQKHQMQLTMNNQDNQQHQQTELMKNHEDNLTARWIASMKEQQQQQFAQQQMQMDQFTQGLQQIIDAQQQKMNGMLDLVKHTSSLEHEANEAVAEREHAASQSDADREAAAAQQDADRKAAADQAAKAASSTEE